MVFRSGNETYNVVATGPILYPSSAFKVEVEGPHDHTVLFLFTCTQSWGQKVRNDVSVHKINPCWLLFTRPSLGLANPFWNLKLRSSQQTEVSWYSSLFLSASKSFFSGHEFEIRNWNLGFTTFYIHLESCSPSTDFLTADGASNGSGTVKSCKNSNQWPPGENWQKSTW